MPITTIDYPHEVPYVQVLDAEGNLDAANEPDIPKDDLRKLYRTMLVVRAHDENRLRLQRAGEIGTFAPCMGQEAAQLGSIYAVTDDDWFVPSFRETACAAWRGAKLEDDLLYCAGYEEGIGDLSGSKNLPLAIPIGTQINHAAGVAWAEKLNGDGKVAITYIGDGGTSEGDWHEGMNLAGVLQLPMVCIVQNNHWAISVPRHKQTKSKTIAQKGWAYGIPGVQVDGNDILGVYKVTKEAVERARKGEGPTLIEAITYRMSVHTTADDPSKYRKEEEVEPWRARDPITRFRTYLINKGYLTEEEHDEWQEEAKKEVKDAVDRFREMLPENLDNMFEHHMAELPAYTRKQKEELEAYWKEHDMKTGGH